MLQSSNLLPESLAPVRLLQHWPLGHIGFPIATQTRSSIHCQFLLPEPHLRSLGQHAAQNHIEPGYILACHILWLQGFWLEFPK